jgi:transcription-repair coupling factor (superfamily II helicase)
LTERTVYTGGALPAEPTFLSKLGDLGTIQLPTAAAPDPALLDPLPSLDPPEDQRLIRARDAAASTPGRGAFHVTGVVGAAAALVALELHQQRKSPVVCVAEDGDAAQKLAADLAFLLGLPEPGLAASEVLLLPPYENTPYAEVNPDRRAMLGRLATLAHLALKRPFRFLVVTAASLVRKVLPPEYVARQTRRVEAESEGERDELARTLIQGGYMRAPVVEDPGTFALRGALLDVWPPSSPEPVRIEFYGDLVLSMKAFEPESQRTIRDVAEVILAPVREGVGTETTAARVKEAIHDLCDAHAWPTSKARTLVEDVLSGRPFFGSDGFLPAFTELTSILEYVGTDTALVLEDPAALVRAIRDELGRAMADEGLRLSTPHFPRDAFYFSEPELVDRLQERGLLCLHRGMVAGGVEAEDLEALESAPQDAPTLNARTHDDLERAGKQARKERGKAGTLEPLVRRIHAWTEAGLVVALSARAETQAERLTALLRHAGVNCRNRVGRFELGWLQEPGSRGVAQIVVGPLSRGAVLPGEGLVLVTEEEVFGSRAHRAARRERKGKDKAKAFLEDLRTLEVGDYVVHSEHGVGRYQGLVHREVNGHTVDLLVVEYGGGDRLYLPVYRLNQIQKFSGVEGAPKLDKLGGSTFAKTKVKAEKQARQMADELLRLYAERQSIPGHALPEADDEYAAFEATFPYEETPDQLRAIEEVSADMERDRPMDQARLRRRGLRQDRRWRSGRPGGRPWTASRWLCLCPPRCLPSSTTRISPAGSKAIPCAWRC